jgi:hypothetical protein
MKIKKGMFAKQIMCKLKGEIDGTYFITGEGALRSFLRA